MSQWASGVLTAAGRKLQAKVEAGAQLNLTCIKLGDGTETMDDVDTLIDLVNTREILNISASIAENDVATIVGVMTTSPLQTGFRCREWGLFAEDPDDGEILYMVTIDSKPEWLPASTEASQVTATYALKIATANCKTIVVNIDPAGLVDVDMLRKAADLVERNTAYNVGDILHSMSLKHGLCLKCITSGTTGPNEILLNSQKLHDLVKDGTVSWMVVREITTNGDIFRRDTDGNITMDGYLDYSEGVSFQLELDGGVTVAPKRFLSNKFIRKSDGGFVIPNPETVEPVDSDPTDIDENNVPTATDDDIDSLFV